MKSPLEVMMAWASLAALLMFAGSASAASVNTQGRTITKVVKMLEAMLEKSKADGDKDREIYAKFKCYCDTNEEKKNANIELLTKDIALLESDIEALQGSNGELSTKCAKLKADMATNEQAQDEATQIRKKEKKAYKALKADAETAMDQMDRALSTLAEVGADQTAGEAADHQKFMAGYKGASLMRLKSHVKEALVAASAFLPTEKSTKVASFIQAPFTGTYTAQSGEVVGILKNMRDTFKENLKSATALETQQAATYKEVMQTLTDAHDTMSKSYDKAQGQMGSDDTSLGTKKDQLNDAKKELATDEEFLSQLVPMCEQRAKEYKARNMMRAGEDAAVSEAIAILNKDSAFETFGKVDATSTGATSFLQRAAIRSRPTAHSIRMQTEAFLQHEVAKDKQMRLVKVLAMLQADNPFTSVLAEIDTMVELIKEEGKKDAEELKWCKAERKTTRKTIKDKGDSIIELTRQIDGLVSDIEAPEEGLKAMIQTTEQQLEDNYEAQKTQTEQRKKENTAYQADIANLVQATKLIESAVKVLKKYYAKVAEGAENAEPTEPVEPLAGETGAPPSAGIEEGYTGGSTAGGKVIEMLEFIQTETEKEESTAHSNEREAQHAFEDSMAELKDEEETAQKSLLSLKKTLAEKETELAEKKEDRTKTEEDKAAAEDYLEKIKPGCDFITKNFELREKRRLSEKNALIKAKGLLKGTPAYKNAVAAQDLEDLGDCKEACQDGAAKETAECQACLSDVTVPAYCAGHAGTPGC